MRSLEDFIKQWAASPPVAGGCCRMVDDWIKNCNGLSALSRFGRDFRTQEEVNDWLSEPGSIAVAVNRVMRSCGYPKVKEPRLGDVGLVIHKMRPCMAIHAGKIWLVRDDAALAGVPLGGRFKAWRVLGE